MTNNKKTFSSRITSTIKQTGNKKLIIKHTEQRETENIIGVHEQCTVHAKQHFSINAYFPLKLVNFLMTKSYPCFFGG